MLVLCVDDCKHVFYRNASGSSKRGQFSREEDESLLISIQKALQLSPLLTPTSTHSERVQVARSISEVQIPWEAVATYMNNERKGVDYLRRWPKYRYKLVNTGKEDTRPLLSAPTTASSSSSNTQLGVSGVTSGVDSGNREGTSQHRNDIKLLSELKQM